MLRQFAGWIVVAVLALLAAPAHALLDPVPARTFELRVPSLERAVEPGKRFNLVGLRWRGATDARVALRVRRGGRWSRWVRLESGDASAGGSGERRARGYVVTDPVWVGQADALEVRSDRRLLALRAAFENTTGTSTAGDRTRTAVRQALRSGVARLGTLLGADADAATPPEIAPRAAWERGQCTPRRAPEEGVVRAAFIHHTVSLNEYSAEESPDIVLAICRYHVRQNGWNDLGYNFVVDRHGQVFEGRVGGIDRSVVGAHAQGWNSQSTGVAAIGTYEDAALPEPGAEALARLVGWKLSLHGVRADAETTLVSGGGRENRYPSGRHTTFPTVAGHRDGDRTACPGDALHAQLPEIRRRAADYGFPLRRAGVSAPTLESSRRVVPYRARVTLTGHAPGTGGGVDIQLDRDGRWGLLERLAPDRHGAFSLAFRVGSTHRYRAHANGVVSDERRVLVRPRIATLLRGGKQAIVGERLRLHGRVRPMKSRLIARLERLGVDGRWHTAERHVVRTRRGRGWATFRPPMPGRYRLRALTFGDRRHAAGRSHARFVDVSRR